MGRIRMTPARTALLVAVAGLPFVLVGFLAAWSNVASRAAATEPSWEAAPTSSAGPATYSWTPATRPNLPPSTPPPPAHEVNLDDPDVCGGNEMPFQILTSARRDFVVMATCAEEAEYLAEDMLGDNEFVVDVFDI